MATAHYLVMFHSATTTTCKNKNKVAEDVEESALRKTTRWVKIARGPDIKYGETSNDLEGKLDLGVPLFGTSTVMAKVSSL